MLPDVFSGRETPVAITFEGVQVIQALQEPHFIQSAPPPDLLDDQEVDKALAGYDGELLWCHRLPFL
ncbi:hypothetical protein M1202_34270 [Streptomyces ardesiacus]|nr:hypothetical protein [Streptomyces ardesiacus]MCL7370442.1 hypothetical protein [Streptomyces ardesiacus]